MKTCFIVDDSKVVRKVTRLMVELQGFEVLEAEDAKQALDQLHSSAVDVVILDCDMPGMDGLECLKALRADTAIHQPKVIFCMAEDDAEVMGAAMAAGADAPLVKPFDKAALVTALKLVA